MENAANARAAALLRTLVKTDRWPDLSDEELGRRLHDAIDERIRAILRQEPHIEPDSSAVVVDVLRQWEIAEVDRSGGADIFEALRVRIPESRPLFEDVLPTLEELRRRGFLLGAVSNRHWGGQSFQEDLEALGLLRHIDPCHIAISVDLGIRKPNPAIFQHALRALDVQPGEAAMVGDSLLSDVAGAKQVGLFAIWKPKAGMRERLPALLAARSAADANAQRPAGLHLTDDDYILAQVQQQQQAGVEPDLIIEHIGELLDIFTKAGD